ncbi:ABC transporter permease [Micromonospora sp. NPDC000089]|uniref:ABC transporter permease n=1 Tax=unclassified Micromonospora TaxID=2617518 RepID=UPI0036B7094A
MNTAAVSPSPTLYAVVAALALAGAGVVAVGRLGPGRAVLTAAGRAVLQLGAVSLVIAAVLGSWWATVGFVGVMLVVASATAARRAGGVRTGWPLAAPITGGVAPVLALLVGTRALPASTLAVLPGAGILIGGAMTATTLAARRALDELRTRHGEYEAGLALGFSPRDAALEVCRVPAGQALVPALDQTRTVGLVTLPGAFVGVLLGGGSPARAGATQLLILVALLAVEAVAVAGTVELVARGLLGAPVRLPASPRG